MLYIQTGIITNRLRTVHHVNDWQDLLAYPVAKAPEINSAMKAKSHKRNKAAFVIAGNMRKPIRQNANLLSRSILFFDIDDTNGDDYPTAVTKIKSALDQITYYIYPTVSNGYKGTRLRVAIPIEEPFNSDQRIRFGSYLAKLLPENWQTDLTSYRTNWSQLAGLPVLNAYSLEQDCQPFIHQGAFLRLDQLPTDTADTTKVLAMPKLSPSPYRQPTRQPWQAEINRVLTTLIHPPSTHRHLYNSSLIGSLLFLKLDQSVIETLLDWSNAHSDNPLSKHELKRVLLSVSRTAGRKQANG